LTPQARQGTSNYNRARARAPMASVHCGGKHVAPSLARGHAPLARGAAARTNCVSAASWHNTLSHGTSAGGACPPALPEGPAGTPDGTRSFVGPSAVDAPDHSPLWAAFASGTSLAQAPRDQPRRPCHSARSGGRCGVCSAWSPGGGLSYHSEDSPGSSVAGAPAPQAPSGSPAAPSSSTSSGGRSQLCRATMSGSFVHNAKDRNLGRQAVAQGVCVCVCAQSRRCLRNLSHSRC
jgi:hypothetical protein